MNISEVSKYVPRNRFSVWSVHVEKKTKRNPSVDMTFLKTNPPKLGFR